METTLELLSTWFDLFYLIIIILGGKIITDDRFAIKKPFWLKSLLLKITASWRILIFSALVGFILHQFDDTVELKKLMATFLLANSMYALLFKFVFEWIENAIKPKE